MKIIKYKIKGIFKILPSIHKDKRGYFFESYHEKKYKKIFFSKFVQDDHSFSKKNVLRGIHFQYKNPQSQLFYLVSGSIFLVTVDFRPKSKTFLKHQVFYLNSKNHEQIYTPPGVGCGFYSLKNNNHLIYKISEIYKKNSEIGVIWNDPKLKIKWPCTKPIMSTKDKEYKTVDQIDFLNFSELLKL